MSETVTAAYVHVPFCIHRCGYCDFTVIANRDDLLEIYLDCMEQELKRELPQSQEVKTLFIGGGTPNYLPAKHLERLLKLLRDWLPLATDAEFSMECNPEGFTSDRMKVMSDYGINRVSLGVQSFTDSHLITLERGHKPDVVEDVVRRLRDHGFSNLGFDLIYAVPDQTLLEWEQTLNAAIALTPQHLSTYGLTYEKGTSFWTRRMKNNLHQAEEELERSMYALAMEKLEQAGFKQYELSNYAQPDFHCRHNQVYWNAKPYYGFGPGAAFYLNGVRSTRYRSVTGWIKKVQREESTISSCETLDRDLAAREAVMLGLRQIAGLEMKSYETRFEMSVRDLAVNAYDEFLESGLLEVSEGYLRLTFEGRFLADTIVAEFL